MILSWSYIIEPLARFVAGATGPITYKDYALDPLTGDLAIPVRLVYGVDAVAQRLTIRLGFFEGAWFLDTREGIPYLRNVFIRNPRLPMIESLFRKVARTTPCVDSVVTYSHSLESTTRTYKARMRVKVADRVITLASSPFIVGGTRAA